MIEVKIGVTLGDGSDHLGDGHMKENSRVLKTFLYIDLDGIHTGVYTHKNSLTSLYLYIILNFLPKSSTSKGSC